MMALNLLEALAPTGKIAAPSVKKWKRNDSETGSDNSDGNCSKERALAWSDPRTLQRQNTKIWKQIFPEKENRGLSPNFHIHASVSDLYIPTIGLPIMLEEICRPILGLYKSLTDT